VDKIIRGLSMTTELYIHFENLGSTPSYICFAGFAKYPVYASPLKGVHFDCGISFFTAVKKDL
jgi:hypothetical protein